VFLRAAFLFQSACLAEGKNKLDIGDIVTTPGFQLQCKEVYHALVANYDPNSGEGLLMKVINSCLSKADSSGHSSIAFPTIGVGGFGYPADLMMKTFRKVVENFRPQNLQLVYLVIFPADKKASAVRRTNKTLSNPLRHSIVSNQDTQTADCTRSAMHFLVRNKNCPTQHPTNKSPESNSTTLKEFQFL